MGWKVQWKKPNFLPWHTALALLFVVTVVLGVSVWFSGSKETRDAFASGRRLLIALDSGEIEGKRVTLDELKQSAPEAKKPERKPEEKKPEEKHEEKPPVEKPPEEKSDDLVGPPPPAEPKPAAPAMEPPLHAPPEESPQPAAQSEATPPAQPALPATPMIGVNPALVEKTPKGDLPVISADGTKPWRYYSKPFERKNSQPMVAIIVSGLGHNRAVTNLALGLPEQVTVSFSPYTKDLVSWATSIRANGHEMLIDLPMEPANYPASDPGPYGLLVDKGAAENNKRLEWQMSRFPMSMGFLTPQNEVFTANNEAFKFLLQSLSNRGLLLVVGREPHRKDTREMIDGNTSAIAVADMLLDEELTASGIQTRLAALEELAKKNGYAIAVAQPYPVTVEQLRVWINTLDSKGITLVPLSVIVKLRFS